MTKKSSGMVGVSEPTNWSQRERTMLHLDERFAYPAVLTAVRLPIYDDTRKYFNKSHNTLCMTFNRHTGSQARHLIDIKTVASNLVLQCTAINCTWNLEELRIIVTTE